MSYQEKNGRAGGEDGAPDNEVLGLGSLNTDGDTPSVSGDTPSFKPDQLAQFDKTHYELIRLHSPDARDERGRPIGKAPFKGWRHCDALTASEAREAMEAGHNVGVRLGQTDLVVDVDPRNFDVDDDPVKRLEADLGFRLSDYPTVVTGSGGLHVYMRVSEGVSLRDTHENYPGIEFKGYGRQVVAPGSVHPDAKRAYEWREDPLIGSVAEAGEAPAKLIELVRRPETASGDHAGGQFGAEQLEEMLSGIDASRYQDHDKWLQIMMSCHHATGGEGRQEFIAWSIGDKRYAMDADLIGRRWDSLKSDAKGVTAKTLFKELHDAGNGHLIPRETAADDFADDIGNFKPGGKSKRKLGSLSEEWVWVADAERFIRRSDTKKFNEKGFKSLYQSSWNGGDIVRAVWDGKLPMPKLESLVYIPGQPEFANGSYNLWRPSGVEAKQGDVGVFLDHMAYLFPDEEERGYVLDYLALLVVKPDTKVNFSLLVRGGQGTGKSWIGKLIAKIIGERNVSRPANSEIIGPYTDWQEGAQLVVIDELMTLGRMVVANQLKQVITDDFLRIREIYGKPYSIPNHLNLLCFTNHSDALAIEQGDRRWLVVFTDAKPRDEAYYKTLFDFLDGDGPAAVKYWLMERQTGLNPKGVAPFTRGKAAMRHFSKGEVEQHLSELLEDGAAPFDFSLVRFDDVAKAVPADIVRRVKNLRNHVTKWLTDEAGARKQGRYTKPGDDKRPNWTLWSIDDHDRWDEVGAAERIDAFMDHLYSEPEED